KQLDKSIPLFEETVKRREAKVGRNHPETLQVVANLGVNFKDAGRLKEAIPLLEEAYEASKRFPEFSWVGKPLLEAYAAAGESAKFVASYREQLSQARMTLPKESIQFANRLAPISRGLLDLRRLTEAYPLL